jgi:hypothetical protein
MARNAPASCRGVLHWAIQSALAENVSQSFGRPESMARLNEPTRCSDEP